MTRKLILAIILFASIPFISQAQRVSISTNAAQWANFMTYNGELGVAVSRHFSINGGARFNNKEKDLGKFHEIRQNQQMTFYGGVKYWPWYVNSGLWYGVKGQYQDFARSCLWRPALEEGKAVGAGISAGYTIMLTKHLNLDFGACIWAGSCTDFTLYDCPVCLNVRKSGKPFFCELDDILVSLVFVF